MAGRGFVSWMFLIVIFFGCGGENEKGSVILPESVDEVNLLLSNVREDFQLCQELGYSLSECFTQNLNYLKQQSNVAEAQVGPDRTTILFTHISGLEGAFLARVRTSEEFVLESYLKEQSPILTSLSFQRYAAIYEAPNFSDLDERIKEILERAGFRVQSYLGDEFSRESLKDLSQYSIAVIIGHGFLNQRGEACFITGEKSLIPITFGPSIFTGIGISSHRDADGGYFYICPAYFDYMKINFLQNSFLLVNACHSLETNNSAERLAKRGLTLYLGWTDTVSVGCSDASAEAIFGRLTEGYTIDEIFNLGIQIPIPDFYGEFGECICYRDNANQGCRHDKNGEKIVANLRYYPSWAGDFKINITEEPKGKSGDPCEDGSDCESKECLESISGWAGNYCYQNCLEDLDCPDESWCALFNPYLISEEDYWKGVCLKKCYYNVNCRDGYFCASIDNGNFGVCIPKYHDGEWVVCGKVFEELEAWNCAPGMECLRIYGAPSDLGTCGRVCNPLYPDCENCFSEINHSLDGKIFCGICCDNCSYLSGGFEALCGPSEPHGYKDFCVTGTDCFGYEGGEFRCYALCDLSVPNCPAGRYCSEIQDYCQGIGGCMP